MNIFKSIWGKLRGFTLRELVVLTALALIAGAIIFGDAKASLRVISEQHPQYLGADQNGYHFKVKGEAWMCRTLGDSRVWCISENEQKYICVFQSPPVYFNECEILGATKT